MNTESIDLIYLDPPFNKNQMFYAIFGNGKKKAGFKDVWDKKDIKDEWVELIQDQQPKLYKFLNVVEDIGIKGTRYYLIYMAIRLLEMHRILKSTGSIYLHCDQTMSHYLKILLDCIFNEKNFRNEIVWSYDIGGRSNNEFAKKHDIILAYAKHITKYKFYDSNIRIPYKTEVAGRKNPLISPEKYEKGKIPTNVWTDIHVNLMMRERTGYPTQKPLLLLDRVIKASSKENDIVLDPFCGCATTCVSAENTSRQWIGIDKEKETYRLVKKRIKDEIEKKQILFKVKTYNKLRPPTRTDAPHKIPKEAKQKLYGKQEGYCNGCKKHFEHRNLNIDHIVPKAMGGTNDEINLQLLCGSCNSIKGHRTMTFLREQLQKDGIIK